MTRPRGIGPPSRAGARTRWEERAHPDTLEDWLAWQEALHPAEIELGLGRVREVLGRLGGPSVPYAAITVGGTNGKGSSVAMLEAILRAAGYTTGAYTSPHLLRYNERVRIDGLEAGDAELCEAFARVERARGEVPLTYFEFGTLAALTVFRERCPDVVVLEVGLGGRLDAVNAVDPDCALLTSVAVDHEHWLGAGREAIGREKAGIFRAARPAVCADPEPPDSVLRAAREVGADLLRLGADFGYRRVGSGWSWWGARRRREDLPPPRLFGERQLRNAAGVLMALDALAARLPVSEAAVHRGLATATLRGRLEVRPGPVEWLLDVAHNPEAAAALAEYLAAHPVEGRNLVVVGMLADKDPEATLGELDGLVEAWHLAGLEGPRGTPPEVLEGALRQIGARGERYCHPTVREARAAAMSRARDGDRVVVFGSFYTVAACLDPAPA